MTLQEMQQAVDNWIHQHGVRYFHELTNVTLLMEEVGELARHMARQYGEQSYKDGAIPDNTTGAIADEMADILFVLTCLANQTGINLEAAVKENLNKKTSRDSDRHRRNPKLNP